jgi:hypothetical protein
MTPEEQNRLFMLIANPPPGSKIEAARDFGVDLTLLVNNLKLTPDQRVRKMESAMRFAEQLREALRQAQE